jgi:two-component system, sensor histidine kinase and response regulator
VIAIPSHAMKGDRERCLDAGMDGYLSKPVKGQEIDEALARLLPAGAVPLPSERVTWDPSKALERLGGDEGLLKQILAIFLEEYPKHVEKLETAVSSKDAPQLERTAHSLKGELSYMGATEVSQLARRLEEMGKNRELGSAEEALAALERELSDFVQEVRTAVGANREGLNR